MKKFLSLTLVLVLIAVAVSHKTEILEAVDSVFGSDTVINWNEVSAEESELGSAYKNHFGALDEAQKKAYNHILSEVYNAEAEFPTLIQIPLMTGDELTEVIQALNYDNPTLMCFGRNSTIATSDGLCFFKPSYTLTPPEQRVRANTLNSVCEQILAQLPEGSDEFETELFIHDYIVNKCTYDVTVAETSSTPYSCLIDGLSACEGYSKAAKLLCEKAGLECYTVSGEAVNYDGKTEGHMWNIIKIDGEYYHLDVTWDDPTAENSQETLSHLFMNLSDEEISIDHFGYPQFFDCTSTKANYFAKTDRLFSSLNSKAVARLKQLMAQSPDGHIEIRFRSEAYYNEAVRYLITNGRIYKIVSSANKIYGTDLSTQSVGYIETKERNALDLYFD
ncbi:MAG: hypothetical protein IJZ57_07900 [Clostridia bacterium]|nr:hypothetical protein [Clostridia bacterium]